MVDVTLTLSTHPPIKKVTVGVRSEDWAKARALLDPQIRVVELASDDAWIRDTGPTFIVKVRCA